MFLFRGHISINIKLYGLFNTEKGDIVYAIWWLELHRFWTRFDVMSYIYLERNLMASSTYILNQFDGFSYKYFERNSMSSSTYILNAVWWLQLHIFWTRFDDLSYVYFERNFMAWVTYILNAIWCLQLTYILLLLLKLLKCNS